MAEYRGEVIENTDDDFPFMTIIYDDDTGDVIAEFPVRTLADGEAKIAEVLRDLTLEAGGGASAA